MTRSSDLRAVGGRGSAAEGPRSEVVRWPRVLGDRAGPWEAGDVRSEAERVFVEILPTLSSDAAPVCTMLAIHATHVALHAYFSAKAVAAGLDSETGLKLLEVADRQSQRAERTLVTVHDLARVHAGKAQKAYSEATPWLLEASESGDEPGESDGGKSQ